MEKFEAIEGKAFALIFAVFGVCLLFFLIFENDLFILGLTPIILVLHYLVYKSNYLKNFTGAFVRLTDSNLEIVRPSADYRALISFKSINKVSESSSLFLPSVVILKNDGQKIELVNFKAGLAGEINSRLNGGGAL